MLLAIQSLLSPTLVFGGGHSLCEVNSSSGVQAHQGRGWGGRLGFCSDGTCELHVLRLQDRQPMVQKDPLRPLKMRIRCTLPSESRPGLIAGSCCYVFGVFLSWRSVVVFAGYLFIHCFLCLWLLMPPTSCAETALRFFRMWLLRFAEFMWLQSAR